jgi:uncharacterized protein
MRVLLDTNVLASAAATRGLCADVLREVLANHELVVSSQIVTELRRTLRKKFAVPPGLVTDFVSLIRRDTLCCEPTHLPELDLKDKDDLCILAAAVSGGVHVVVTGDGELQKLGHVSGIKIMSPRQFWDELTAPPQAGGTPDTWPQPWGSCVVRGTTAAGTPAPHRARYTHSLRVSCRE